ncbi:MAG: YggS family pyridoxal phosphate-dependent enzyme [Parvularculaceae bacterium]
MSGDTETPDPKRNLDAIRERIAAAARDAGRDAAEITLIAVAKKHGRERILPALDAGHRDFGENRVQEAAAKWPELKAARNGVRLHMIGPLQSNKTDAACALFDAIHTLDRPKLAAALAARREKGGALPELFIQVNTGEEPQKAGVGPGEADAFIDRCREEFGLSVSGLMCIPPVEEEPSLHFALLAKIADRNGLKNLSMGMSGDFETAIAFGATHIRIGEAIFGPRARG